MATQELKVLRLGVDELRRLFGRLTHIYDGLKIKVLALIAGEVAIVSFIFADGNIIPAEIYGRIFFCVGVLCVAVAFSLLLWIISTVDWLVPYDTKESRKLTKRYKTEQEFLLYLKEDYELCTDHCNGKIGTRAKVFNRTVLVLSAGVIILLVLRFSTTGG